MAEITAWIIGEVKQGKTLPALHSQIGNVTENDTVIVNIISEGGSYGEGMDCYNYLKSLPCAVYTVAKGTVASIATLIQLAAPKENRKSETYAKPLIHNPWGEFAGDSKTLLNYSEALKEAEDDLVAIYVKETGSDEQSIRAAMETNDFITVEQYMELGFISEIVEPLKAVAILDIQEKPINQSEQSIMNQIEAKLNSLFGNISKKLGIKNEFTEEVKAMMVELEDGSKINIVTESESPEVGNPVQYEDGTPAADGDYTLADGTMIRVVEGVISEMIEAKSNEDEEMQALKAENETLKAQVTDLTAKIETYAQTMETINAKIEQTYKTPVRRNTVKASANVEKDKFTKDDLKTKK